MPEKDFEILINAETVIRVYRNTEFRTINIICHCFADFPWRRLDRYSKIRYRTRLPASGHFRKKGGLLQKIWYDDLSPKQVFSLAISTFKSNHEQIKAQFLAH